ncbi:MAG: metallophosphoesterase [Candidatus Atribacteria bacterium]|nr:metallophosphoesterase [Candidatus Atribacteria bacterium]
MILRQRDPDDEVEWSDVAEYYNKYTGQNVTRCTIRKGFFLLAPFLEAGAVNPYQNYDGSSVATRILSVSDFHVPFQLPVSTFEDYIGKVDILQLNGDISDCQAISKFPKSYRVSPMEEIIETRKYLIELIDYIKPKKVVANFGNHEIRFQNYLSKNLDSDLLELMPKTSLELIFVDGFKHYNKRERTKIEYKPLCEVIEDVEIEYTDNWFCQIGKTIFCHPLAFSSGIMKTSENAMNYFRNEGYDFRSLVMAHTHRVGQYEVGNTTLFEQGCCCDTKKQHYSDGRLTKSQKEGFLYICQDSDGEIIKSKTRLVCLN